MLFRSLKIPADLYLYPDGYLIAILESDEPVSESFYYIGHRTILGVFPATGNKAYLFYMIPKDSMEAVKQRGILALQQIWSQIAPQFSRLFRSLRDWGRPRICRPGGYEHQPGWRMERC